LETAKSRFWQRAEVTVFGNGNRAKDCEGSKIKMLRKMRISKRREKPTKRVKRTHDLFCDCRKCVRSSVQYLKELNKA
jgi:hypothetical protein